jgi:hypothetical protein
VRVRSLDRAELTLAGEAEAAWTAAAEHAAALRPYTNAYTARAGGAAVEELGAALQLEHMRAGGRA